jgi:hypothetical protein
MQMIRGIIILHLVCFCLAAEVTSSISLKTGDKLAVLKFEGWAISKPLSSFLTEEFRRTIRGLDIFQVQDSGITNQINIYLPRSEDYWSCWDKKCAIDLGRRLEVNYIISGNIQQKEDKAFLISGRLFSVDMEMLMNEFVMNSSGITDSLLLEMKKMAYNVSGLPIPDTLLVGSDTSEVEVAENIKRKQFWDIELPKIPNKIKALIMSTILPGSGQVWAEKKYPGYGFMGVEGVLGASALLAYDRYDKSWGGFERNYNDYNSGTDPHELLELRPKIIQYAKETERYNAFMKNIRTISLSIWVVNMMHAYLVTPEDDFF